MLYICALLAICSGLMVIKNIKEGQYYWVAFFIVVGCFNLFRVGSLIFIEEYDAYLKSGSHTVVTNSTVCYNGSCTTTSSVATATPKVTN